MTTHTPRISVLRASTIAAAIVFSLAVSAGSVDAAIVNSQLDFGETNSDVTALQTFLATDNSLYPEGLITGYFGAMTRSAVLRYQARFGIAQVGRVGPQTLASINGIGGVGGTGGTGGSDDVNAPIVTSLTVSASTNSATVTWTSNEAVFGKVLYATYWPYVFATAPSVNATSGFGSTQSATINGLQSHTTYYYTLETTDAAGNLTWTINRTFTTQ